MLATFAILMIYYTGLNTLTNGEIKWDVGLYLIFMFGAVSLASTINSMLYINTLHKDIEDLQKDQNKKLNNKVVIENEK